MSELSVAVARFKRELLSRETQSLVTMTKAFTEGYDRIVSELEPFIAVVEARITSGEEVSQAWMAKEARLKELLRQITSELTTFTQFADVHVSEQQLLAVTDAQTHASELIRLAQGQVPDGFSIPESFTRYNAGAVLEAVGKLSEGSPLRDLLLTIAPKAVAEARKALVGALVAGENPRQTARILRDSLNVPLTRALTIARTEVLGAYRAASLETYQANADVVKGWEWSCEFSSRTCAMCIAMSGTFHELSEPFGSHPNCRCSPVPVTKTWEELGFTGIPDTRPKLEQGVDWFAKQPEATQLAILGRGKFDLYKSGELKLQDLVGYRDDPKWGPTRWERSIKEVQSSAQGE